MPQLSPASGLLMFLMVGVMVLMVIISNSTTLSTVKSSSQSNIQPKKNTSTSKLAFFYF